jgi:tRNA threonylcarbamoyladenosine biosynthesis protein TsaE
MSTAATNIFASLRRGVTTRDAAATQAIAAEFAASLPPDTTLALHGDLGVGKTTFVQGLARGLKSPDAITSPTFNLYSLYRGPERLLVHLDAYRLESPRQVEELLLEDFLVSPWCLAIEWPEKIEGWLPPGALHLTLAIERDQSHTVKLA